MKPMTSPMEYLVDICPKNKLKFLDWNAIFNENKTLPLSFLVKHQHQFKDLALWPEISSHPNLTIKFIKKHYTKYHKKPFNWHHISCHPNITMKIIEDNPDLPWKIWSIFDNPNLTVEFINKHKDEQILYTCVTLELLEASNIKEWDWKSLSYNSNVTIDFIKNNLCAPWDWSHLSERKDILPIVELLPEVTWKWDVISNNPNITIEFINNLPNKNWNWEIISRHPNITMDIIEKHINKPWHWGIWGVSCNPNLTMTFINNYSTKSWDWDSISKHPNIRMTDIEEHPNKPWDWEWISDNPNFKITMIEKFPNKDWNLEDIWTNKDILINLSLDDIIKNIKHIEQPFTYNWEIILTNENMSLDKLTTFRDIVFKTEINDTIDLCEFDFWKIISENPNINVEFIKLHINKPWNWCKLAINPNLFNMFKKLFELVVSRTGSFTLHNLLRNLNLMDDSLFFEIRELIREDTDDEDTDDEENDDSIKCNYITDNTPELTDDFIKSLCIRIKDTCHTDKLRCFNWFICNPNITLEFIETNINHFDEKDLQSLMNIDMDRFLIKEKILWVLDKTERFNTIELIVILNKYMDTVK